MMKPIFIIAAVGIFLLVIFGWGQPFYTIDMNEQAIITQFGEYQKTVRSPGLHAKLPFVQKVIRYEKRIIASDAPPGEYLDFDKKRLEVDHVTRFRIVDPLQFFKSVATVEVGLNRLQAVVFSELRDELALHPTAEIISVKREQIMETVAQRVAEKVGDFGMEIVDLRIKRADLPAEVLQSVYGRMQAERQREAKRYRAEGEEQAFEIRAQADKEKTVILAEAYEESQRLRGEGDAQATEIYAAAYGQDPEFFSFLRSLLAYETFLVGETTLVLDSDSDLFRYLSGPGSGE